MKKLLLTVLASLSIVGMAGCSPTTTDPTTGPTTSDPTTSDPSISDVTTVTPPSTSEVDPDVKTNKDFELARTTYERNGKTFPLTRDTLYTNAGAPHLNPTEEQHVLVVPFGFNNPKYPETPETIEKIKKVFFGTDEELAAVDGWKSVAGYYNQSSFGKGKFAGEVIPTWVMWDGKESDACSGVTCAEYAAKWYKEEYAKENHGALGVDAKPISYFDNNGDGYLDLVWIVYSHPTGSTGDWWAYVTYTSNSAGSKNNPAVKTLGFASVDWMNEGFGGYDAHTYIHETGHTFGIDDYYDYTSSWSPFCGWDMMDNNAGDHNAYSKFANAWVNPLIVDDTAEITLRSTTLTGDCFVVGPKDYNGTAFDEYLMVEFLTAEGLNEADYKKGNGYSQPGVRISHVDSRVYNNVSTRDGYLSENPEDGLDVRIGNTKGGRMGVKVDGDYWPDAQGSSTGKYMAHLTLLESTINDEKNGMNTYGYKGSNDSLFQKGERLNFKEGWGWSELYMASGTNLWNKAKTITGWEGKGQLFEVDETMTIDYNFRVKDIVKENGEWKAVISVTKVA